MDAKLMEERLRAFYQQHNAANQQNIAEIVRKFAGREAQLCAKLRKKYGAAPDLTTPPEHKPKLETAVYDPMFVPYRLPKLAGGVFDLRSREFDALQALQVRDGRVALLTPVHPLDNIQKCRVLLPTADPNRQDLTPVRAKKPEKPSTATARPSTAAPPPPTLFEQLADTYLDGPFALLRRCFLSRRRVLVVVRRVNSVRGTCCGLLKAFDKHLNVLLLDATLDFVPLAAHLQLVEDVRDGKRSPADAVFSTASPALNRRRRLDVQREHRRQLFIRGDNVVAISTAAH